MTEKDYPPGAPATRRRRSAQVARREILDAAQQRLSQGGPDAIRLQEIANDVGISHPTILHHFGSRDGLIRALDVRAIHALTDDIARMIQEDRDPDAAGVDLVERVAETMDKEGLARLIAWWAMRDFDAAGSRVGGPSRTRSKRLEVDPRPAPTIRRDLPGFARNRLVRSSAGGCGHVRGRAHRRCYEPRPAR